MLPQRNSNDELSVYADWLEDSGHSARSDELRVELLNEETTKSNWMALSGYNDGRVGVSSGFREVGCSIYEGDEANTPDSVGTCDHCPASVGGYGYNGVGTAVSRGVGGVILIPFL